MPLTRISVSQNVFERYKRDISAILQHCLETHFDVPSGDCFQLFDIHQPQQKVFDVHYPNCAPEEVMMRCCFTLLPESHAATVKNAHFTKRCVSSYSATRT